MGLRFSCLQKLFISAVPSYSLVWPRLNLSLPPSPISSHQLLPVTRPFRNRGTSEQTSVSVLDPGGSMWSRQRHLQLLPLMSFLPKLHHDGLPRSRLCPRGRSLSHLRLPGYVPLVARGAPLHQKSTHTQLPIQQTLVHRRTRGLGISNTQLEFIGDAENLS